MLSTLRRDRLLWRWSAVQDSAEDGISKQLKLDTAGGSETVHEHNGGAGIKGNDSAVVLVCRCKFA